MEKSGSVQGALWGTRARDWANLTERVSRPLYEAVLARCEVGAGSAYLDAGCGAGGAAQLAAARGARVSGFDASEALLAIARERTPAGDFRLADLESVPFDDASFDVITGFNSFQYAARPVAALEQARRVARRGARVAIAIWAPPERTEAAAIIAALKPLLPAPPPGAPGPFALSDENALRTLAREAQLEPLEIIDVECPFAYPELEIGVRALDASGVAAKAMAHSGEEAVTRAHREVLQKFRRDDGSILVPNRFRFLLSRA